MSHVDGEDDGVGYGVSGHSNKGTGVKGSIADAVFDPDVTGGVYGISKDGTGIRGDSDSDNGVFGHSKTGIGVFGRSDDKFGTGVYGTVGSNISPDSEDSVCVFGDAFRKGTGVRGKSDDGIGVFGESDRNYGVRGTSGDGIGVFGESAISYGVRGQSNSNIGVTGESINGIGVRGTTDTNAGLFGISNKAGGIGLRVWGLNDSDGCIAVSRGAAGTWIGGVYAGLFYGNVKIYGNLSASTKSFKIDHPLDPSNKYLYHSSVESSDMKNIYDGVVVLDAKGEAVVVLPDWFEALNKEFRYQLTPIGNAGPNLHISKEIENQRFKIAGGSSGMKVCWLVTGIRHDAFAQANPLVVEQDKLPNEQDYYIHPETYGYPAQKSIVEALYPDELRQFREEQQKIT